MKRVKQIYLALGPILIFMLFSCSEGILDIDVEPMNQFPVVRIISPQDSSTFTEGTMISFTATAFDPEDGNISNKISWSAMIPDYDFPSVIGAGFQIDDLPIGTYTLRASAPDSEGRVGVARVTISVISKSGP